jgi:hypothetical protein
MKVVVSLTSTPPRFAQLPRVLARLCDQACHEIWVNIPARYERFPDWDGHIPTELYTFGPRVRINSGCEDFGPATKSIAPATELDPEDLIVYLDDDTDYDKKLVLNLLKWQMIAPGSAWGLSGFNFDTYFQKKYPRTHGSPMDVLEGYGSVIVRAGWIQNLIPEFKEIRDGRTFLADDIIISNLLARQGIERRTIFTPDCNIGRVGQFEYGFGPDALHAQIEGGHHANYRAVLEYLEDKGKNYFKNRCW